MEFKLNYLALLWNYELLVLTPFFFFIILVLAFQSEGLHSGLANSYIQKRTHLTLSLQARGVVLNVFRSELFKGLAVCAKVFLILPSTAVKRIVRMGLVLRSLSVNTYERKVSQFLKFALDHKVKAQVVTKSYLVKHMFAIKFNLAAPTKHKRVTLKLHR